MKTIIRTLLLLTCAIVASVQGADNMKAFPPAEEGMVRYVLNCQRQVHSVPKTAF
jgi:hypothetical protein